MARPKNADVLEGAPEAEIPSSAKEGAVTFSPEEVSEIRKQLAENTKLKIELEERNSEVENMKGMLENLRETMEEIKGGSLTTTKVDSGRIVMPAIKMRKYNDKWIIGWTAKNSYREYDPIQKDYVDYIDVILLGEKQPVKLRLLDLMNDCPQTLIQVKAKRELPEKVKDGPGVERVVYDEAKKAMVSLGFTVPMRVVQKHFEYDVELDGQIVTIDDRFANM